MAFTDGKSFEGSTSVSWRPGRQANVLPNLDETITKG